MKNNKKGFTIVELLVVIVVIGILAAITIVSYGGVTAQANTTTAKTTAKNTIDSVAAYSAVNGVLPMYFSELNGIKSTVKLSGTNLITTTPYFFNGIIYNSSAWLLNKNNPGNKLSDNFNPSSPNSPVPTNSIIFVVCGGQGSVTEMAWPQSTFKEIVGTAIYYFDYSAKSWVTSPSLSLGEVRLTDNGIYKVNGRTVGCVLSSS